MTECQICKKEKELSEKKVFDEVLSICEDCDWSTEDIESANRLGLACSDIIKKEMTKDNANN